MNVRLIILNRNILLGLILSLALFLRLWMLGSLPPSLSWDEVSTGYNAYSILQTGKDEWGFKYPISFRAYGDYKLPGYIYLDVPFVAMFGLNEWGVRLPSAILGVGLVVVVFLILRKLSNNSTALWGAFVTAILPWSVILSRIALEAHLALFSTTLATYFFLIGLKKQRMLLLSSLFFGLSLLSYNSSRVVTPSLVILLSFFFWADLKKNIKSLMIAGVIFLSFLIVILPHAFLQDSSARYRWTAILDEGAINRINELRGGSTLSPTLSLLVYNKVTFFIPEFTKSYLSHFSPSFLFINGGSHFQFSVPGSGLFYPITAPFLLIGLLEFWKRRERWQMFVIVWLLLSFIPAAVTRDSPHALRSLMAIPPLIIITSFGIVRFLEHLKRFKIRLVIILVSIFLVSLIVFWQNYSINYSKNYSWSWQYGYKEAVDFIKKEEINYDKIFFTKKYGEPHEFVLFFLNSNPDKFRSDENLIRYGKSDWFWVDRFGKYWFLNDWEVQEQAKCKVEEKCLLIASPENYPSDWEKIKKINFIDGKGVFEILENI